VPAFHKGRVLDFLPDDRLVILAVEHCEQHTRELDMFWSGKVVGEIFSNLAKVSKVTAVYGV
jgi:hypothetical protein